MAKQSNKGVQAESEPTAGSSSGGAQHSTSAKVASDITVVSTPVDIPETEPGAEQGVGGEQAQATEEVTALTNDAIIETLCMITGKTLVAVTKIPEMAFDEEEVEQLKKVWRGVIPPISPLLSAVMVTSVIMAGKIGTYYELKGVRNGDTLPAEEQGSPLPPAT
jgi:hypothetical protein